MIESPLLTNEVLSLPMINVVSFLKEKRIQYGSELIDLSVGNPDLPPCSAAVDELSKQAARFDIHGYGNFDGQPVLVNSVKNYYQKRFDIDVTSDQINIVRGVRNLLFYIAYIFSKPNDLILVPGIGYQSYYLATIFNHCVPYFLPLSEENNFVPDLSSVPTAILDKAKLIYLNYPNNPIGSQIQETQLEKLISICKKHEILICYDNAYGEIVFDGRHPISLFQFADAWDIGIEITSMSKMTLLAGWRIAFCTANQKISKLIWNYNAVTDSAVFDGFQFAGAKALDYLIEKDDGKRLSTIFENRRNIILQGLEKANIDFYKPQGGFYVWLKVPKGLTDYEFASEICAKYNVLITPGSYYGEEGTQYARISLTAQEEKLKEVSRRFYNEKNR